MENSEIPKFESGDIVQLKSGGPQMTVSNVNGKIISCMWWEKSKNDYNERDFNENLLDNYRMNI